MIQFCVNTLEVIVELAALTTLSEISIPFKIVHQQPIHTWSPMLIFSQDTSKKVLYIILYSIGY